MDSYGYGKTVQFIMANTEIKPALTRKETYQIGKIIDKCIGENAQRQYDDFSQVKRDIPVIKRTKRAAGKKICSDGNYNIIINRIWDIYDNSGKCISPAER